PPVIVLNKIDRVDARAKEVLDEIYDLFIDLDATEDQLGFPVVYTNDPDGILQIQVMNLDYSEFLGRIAIGRVFNGTLRRGTDVGISKLDGKLASTRITKLYTFRGLERDEAEAVPAGDLVAIAGVEGIQIGEGITDLNAPAPFEPLL